MIISAVTIKQFIVGRKNNTPTLPVIVLLIVVGLVYPATEEVEVLRQKKAILLVVLIVLVAVIIVFVRSCGNEPALYVPQTETQNNELDFTPSGDGNKNAITIPGMTGLTMKAGQLEQTVDFYNPEQNECFFKISLYLSDNTLIYQSDYIAPSEHITDIALMQVLERGIYGKCRLVYDCFALDNKAALNSGAVILEINSK